MLLIAHELTNCIDSSASRLVVYEVKCPESDISTMIEWMGCSLVRLLRMWYNGSAKDGHFRTSLKVTGSKISLSRPESLDPMQTSRE